MTDKKPDIDEFNFDEKTEKNNVLDQSMTASRINNTQNPVVLVITAVFFVALVYYFWGGSSAQPVSTHEIVKEMQKMPAPEASVPAPAPLPKKLEIPAPEAVTQSPQPEPVAPVAVNESDKDAKEATASHKESALSIKNIEGILQQLYERQADISSQINHHMTANDKNLQKSHSDLKTIISQLMKDMQEMRHQQGQIEKTMDALGKKILDSNEAMKNIEQVMRVQLQEFQVSQQDLAQPMPAPKYSLHAVIPGRAWLRDGNNIFSVVDGQELEPYGRIISIDARQGTVLTSSGQILRYS